MSRDDCAAYRRLALWVAFLAMWPVSVPLSFAAKRMGWLR